MKRVVLPILPILLILLILLFCSGASAEKLCATIGPSGDMLCVVKGESGLNWYVFTGCEDILPLDPPVTEGKIDHMAASASGRYLVILSSGEAGVFFGLYSTAEIDYGKAPKLEKRFEGFPEGVSGLRWDRETLFFASVAAPLKRFQYDPKSETLTDLP